MPPAPTRPTLRRSARSAPRGTHEPPDRRPAPDRRRDRAPRRASPPRPPPPPRPKLPAMKGGGQMAFAGFGPPPPTAPAIPADTSGLTRSAVERLQARAGRVRDLAQVVKEPKLDKAELAVAHQLLRLTLPEPEGHVTWLDLVLDACTRNGVLLGEVLAEALHTGPVKEARDEAFDA